MIQKTVPFYENGDPEDGVFNIHCHLSANDGGFLILFFVPKEPNYRSGARF